MGKHAKRSGIAVVALSAAAVASVALAGAASAVKQHLTETDASRAEVLEDGAFKVLSVTAGHPHRGPGRPGGPGGPGGRQGPGGPEGPGH